MYLPLGEKKKGFTKIHHVVEIVLFHTDGRTDGHDEIKSHFSHLLWRDARPITCLFTGKQVPR